MLSNHLRVVHLQGLLGWNGVFFYAVVCYLGEGFAGADELLLPAPCQDAVEGGAQSHIKDVDAGGRGGIACEGAGTPLQPLFKQVFQSASDVDVGGFCIGSVLGVVCFVEAGELQCVASVAACGQCVFHFSPDCDAKLGIMV